MRLLYVAMTRARDTLILSGAVAEKRFHSAMGGNGGGEHRRVAGGAELPGLDCGVGAARRAHFRRRPPAKTTGGAGEFTRTWTNGLLGGAAADRGRQQIRRAGRPAWMRRRGEELHQRLAWQYPHPAATQKRGQNFVSPRCGVNGRRKLTERSRFKAVVQSSKLQGPKSGR